MPNNANDGNQQIAPSSTANTNEKITKRIFFFVCDLNCWPKLFQLWPLVFQLRPWLKVHVQVGDTAGVLWLFRIGSSSCQSRDKAFPLP
jgi:hypothetical protein